MAKPLNPGDMALLVNCLQGVNLGRTVTVITSAEIVEFWPRPVHGIRFDDGRECYAQVNWLMPLSGGQDSHARKREHLVEV